MQKKQTFRVNEKWTDLFAVVHDVVRGYETSPKLSSLFIYLLILLIYIKSDVCPVP